MATETSEIAYEELRKFSVDEYHQMAEVINLARHVADVGEGTISPAAFPDVTVSVEEIF